MPDGRAARRWAAGAGAALVAVYACTLAPRVTFWDAGEFVAAARSLGVPHPPGTPLWVLVAHLVTLLPIPSALALNAMSALFTAAALALLGGLVGRWTGWPRAGAAAAVCAGAMSSVWLNATETEVYAASLLLAALTLVAADAAGRTERARPTVLLGYLFALAVPMHLSALVAAPAAIALACLRDDRSVRWSRALALAATFALVQAAGTLRVAPALVGVLLALLAVGLAWRNARDGVADRSTAVLAGCALAGALAITAVAVLYVRALHDPRINQGDPSTVARLLDVVGRRQYAQVDLWPRRAPLWLQAANVFQYVDWQVALGLGPDALPSVGRTIGTVLFVALGGFGAREHFRRDRRGWIALLVLLLCGTAGAALQLNLAAGASIGWGILPDSAPHEARDRDYFFVLGFVAWGLWAGIGAVRLAEARGRGAAGRALGLALAALPVALNWSAVSRRGEPDATIPAATARALLEGAPPHAVLIVAGDNDTYPLWAAQADGVRTDVAVVTASLLPAAWFHAELRRRDSLGVPDAWRGEAAAVADVARAAAAVGRPVALSAALAPSDSAAVPGPWTRRGVLLVRPDAPASAAGDSALAALEAAVARPLRAAADPATRAWWKLARCGATPSVGEPAFLDSPCGGR